MRPLRHLVFLPLLAVLAVTEPAAAKGPVLHEPVRPDAREDVALALSLDGDLPAAIDTPSGLVSAPDPRRPIDPKDSPYAPGPRPGGAPDATFRPDRDTRRPDVLPYDDPFTPSTAPFKRLSAYDTVDASYTLSVKDPRVQSVQLHAHPATDGTDEQFYADMVVDLSPGRRARIPSVGPGARVVRARAGVGTTDVPFRLLRDGADNWFVEADTMTRVRLVMELTIPRATFGGELGDPAWTDLPAVAPLPPNAARAAAEVAARIGASTTNTPRENVSKLVAYFRAFADSDDPPPPTRDIYLDLALSQKGVCRHRAFAFLVTALGLGIPTRVIMNEAHAWVEVFDGRMWKRIDLGGAGRTLRDPLSTNVPYAPPSDPFAWPTGATRGDDLADRARRAADAAHAGPSSTPSATTGTAAPGSSSGPRAMRPNESSKMPSAPDERPASTLAVLLVDPDTRRGAPLHVRGQVSAEGEPCAHVLVEIVLKGKGGHEVPLGSVATDERGAYDGALVLPRTMPVGDYDLYALTGGDTRCGSGGSP